MTGIRDVGVQRRHLHRLITAGESARWLSHLGAAMQAAGVGQSAQAAVMDLLRGPAARLVNDGAPKDVLALAAHIAEGLANAQSPHEDFHPVTPLHYAVDGGSVAATRLLLASGADVRTSGGRLLTSAASQGSIELVRLLLDQGAEAARAESLGPLHTDRTIARLLVARGLDLNVPIRDQETPLTMACRADKGEHPAAVAALLELGADPNAKNAKGRTPLAIATSARFDRTVALLRAAGAR